MSNPNILRNGLFAIMVLMTLFIIITIIIVTTIIPFVDPITAFMLTCIIFITLYYILIRSSYFEWS